MVGEGRDRVHATHPGPRVPGNGFRTASLRPPKAPAMTPRAPLPPSAASSLGIALVLSSPTPLLLLDRDLQVHAASSSFCRAFSLALAATVGSSLFDLGGGEWNVPELRALLESTAAEGTRVDAYEMDLVRPGQGIRNL